MPVLDIKQKVGPMPLWGWLLVTAGGAYIFIRHQASKAAAAQGGDQSGGNTGSGGKFSSTVTTKDAAGNTSTYSASGDNSSIQSPAQLVWGGGTMPYSGGDVYVNYPEQQPPAPDDDDDRHHHGPPAPTPPRNPDWGKWETVTANDTIQTLTARVLGTGDYWDKVWNDPVNKVVHDLRGTPDRLQPNDVVWVFDGWKPGWKPPADFVPYNPDPSHPTQAGPSVRVPAPDASQN